MTEPYCYARCVATYLILADAPLERALPGIRTAGLEFKALPLAAPPSEVADLGPLAVLVDAGTDASRAFLALSDLRTRADDLSTIAIVPEEHLERHPWHEVADDLLLPRASEAQIRVRLAMLRRREGGSEDAEIVLGPLSMNTDTYRVAVDGRPLDLTYKEFELLRFLASRPGVVFTREALLREVWGYDFYGGTRTVDVHVRRLRAKLGPEHEALVETVRGVGYRVTDTPW